MISFVIPAYNSENTIEMCIKSVLDQDVPKEIIVVDDGSSDRTKAIASKFKGVKVMSQDNSGPAAARNVGMRASKGEYVAFIDSDVVLPPDWSSMAIKLLKESGVGGVGGPGISTQRSLVSESLDTLLYGINTSTKRSFVKSLATMDVMYKRSVLSGLEFDQSFRMAAGEDPELNFRIRKMGYKLLFDRSLAVQHHHPTDMKRLMKKWYNYGRNYILLCSKHREMRGPGFYSRVLYIPVLAAFLAASIISPIFLVLPVMELLLLFGFYFYIGTKVCKKRRILAFSIIHTLKQLAQLLGIFASMFRSGPASSPRRKNDDKNLPGA